MSESELDRYRRRIAEEERKAADPENREVRHVHEQLAALYRERLESARQAMPRLEERVGG